MTGRRTLLVVDAHPAEAERLNAIVAAMRVPGLGVVRWSAEPPPDAEEAHGGSGLPAMAARLEAIARRLDGRGTALEDVAVIAAGLGASAALAWAHDYAPRIRCLILLSPRFSAGRADTAAEEGLPRRFRWTMERVVADAQAISTPIALLTFAVDGEHEEQARDRFLHRVGSETTEQHVIPSDEGAAGTCRAAGIARAFLLSAFSRPPHRRPLLDAHRAGCTKDEFDELCRPLPLLSRRRAAYALGSAFLRTAGRLSTGIRIGLATGFDSGSTMDYVYCHEPSGLTRWGRRIDADYLEAPGWRAIRVRRRNLQRFIARAAGELRANGDPVVMVDVAAGVGRYMMEVASQLRPRPERLLLRDYSAADVRQGRALLPQYALQEIAAFEEADAFDRAALAAIRPRPTLAVVCGLYELFPDNDMVLDSLSGLAEAMPPGSVLVYTGLPWHPEREFIGRVLPSHRRGHRCLTRRRTQDELDQLVEHAGFSKTAQAVDEWGIFTVSTATRTR